MDLTICIPTHAVKTDTVGTYAGINSSVPSAPSTKLLEKVLFKLGENTDIDITKIKIIVGFDKRKNREIDEEYYKNILDLSKQYNLNVCVNESEIDDPIETATDNFIKLIGSVTTKYYLFWEHDWIFNEKVKIKPILEEMDSNENINYIRFNQHTNTNEDFDQFISKNNSISDKIDLLPTHRWSNNPYICRSEVFQKCWINMIYKTPEEGGFVEGPMNVIMIFYSTKIGWEETNKKFKCYVFGKWGDPPMVSHLNGNLWEENMTFRQLKHIVHKKLKKTDLYKKIRKI